VTFVCSEQEKDTLNHFAEVCSMCICPLPGDVLAVTGLVAVNV